MRRSTIGTALLILCTAGCSSGTHPVSGKIVYSDGLPAGELAGGLVEVQSVDAEPTVNGRGVIQEDGTFALQTSKPGDGALPGKHRVLIVPPLHAGASDTPGTAQALPRLLDQKYSSYDTSTLEITVTPGLNEVTLEVDRPGGVLVAPSGGLDR